MCPAYSFATQAIAGEAAGSVMGPLSAWLGLRRSELDAFIGIEDKGVRGSAEGCPRAQAGEMGETNRVPT